MESDEQGGRTVEPVLPELLSMIERNERSVAGLAAIRFRLVDALRSHWESTRGGSIFTDPAGLESRALRAEVAAMLSVHERTAEGLISTARTLVGELCATLDALAEGRFGERHARILADNIGGLTGQHARELEAKALQHAPLLTPAKFERKVRTLREMISPSDMTERHREAVRHREIRVEPARDGMAYLSAYIPAPEAVAVDNYLDEIARGLTVTDETRTRAQIRADVFVDLLLDEGHVTPPAEGESELRSASARLRGIAPSVHVTVPALTLAGASDEPAILEGHGPIDPESARRLVGASSGFYRLLTHPETGATLSFGRDKYAVPPELRRHLRTRDGTCRFIGCSRSARHCDIDHTVDWQHDGGTDADNLAHLRRGHHRLKHGTAWKVRNDPGGTLTWTSPAGRDYSTEPESAVVHRQELEGGAVAQTEWLDAEDSDQAPF